MCKKAKVTIKRAAEILGKSQQFVRIGLQRKILPFGVAMQMPGKTTYTYHISPKQFCDYAGIKEIPTQYNNHLDGNFVKNELIKYHQKNGMYPTSINQMDNLVTINNNIYIQ